MCLLGKDAGCSLWEKERFGGMSFFVLWIRFWQRHFYTVGKKKEIVVGGFHLVATRFNLKIGTENLIRSLVLFYETHTVVRPRTDAAVIRLGVICVR